MTPPFSNSLVRLALSLLRNGDPKDLYNLTKPELQSLSHLVRYWHVAPSLWLKLRQHTNIPPTFLSVLHDCYWQNVQRNRQLRNGANFVIHALNAQEIEPLFLKGGTQLFDPLNSNSGTRVMGDLDLLVTPINIQLAFDTLLEKGFIAQKGSYENHHHLPPLLRQSDGLVVEIHKTPWQGANSRKTEVFFDRAIPLKGSLGRAHLPCTEHRLMHNAIHAYTDYLFKANIILHYRQLDTVFGYLNLRQLLDFSELCQFRSTQLNWNAILEEVDQFHHKADFQQWAYLAAELLGAPMPKEVGIWRVDRPEITWKKRLSLCLGSTVMRLLQTLGLLESCQKLKSSIFSR